MPPPPSGGIDFDVNGHEYVDLGLPSGTLWSKYNIGSFSLNGNNSLFFAFGDVVGCTAKLIAEGGFPASSAESLNPDFEDEYLSDLAVNSWFDLPLEYDAARRYLGGTWQLPSSDDIQELVFYIERGLLVCTYDSSYNAVVVKSSKTGASLYLPRLDYVFDGRFVDFVSGAFYGSRSLQKTRQGVDNVYLGIYFDADIIEAVGSSSISGDLYYFCNSCGYAVRGVLYTR